MVKVKVVQSARFTLTYFLARTFEDTWINDAIIRIIFTGDR